MITILIVDDEKLERRGIRFLLKREEGEFQILEATNGKDALGVLESNHVDILFSDVKMPYMNGLELTKAVREDHPDMEIVIFSGYNDFSYAREALRYGVVDYVLKPVDPEEFHKTFQRVMENISSKIEKKEQQEKKEEYVVKKAQEYMEKHCSEQLLLSDIAAQFHLHPNYFSSLFKKQLDMTVRDYILQLRMTKAKELMKDSSLKLLDIALAVGYEDAAHFNRAFKNVTGVSPSMYRDGIKKQ